MNYFPVSNSNLSATHLALYLKEHYPLKANTTCSLIKAGINDTYLVNDGDSKFVLRVYSFNWRTKKEIEEELTLLNLVKEQGVSVSYPIFDKAQNYIHTLNAPEGQRYAVLFSYAAGEKLQTVSKETHFKIGQLMAQLHGVTLNRTLERVNYDAGILLLDALKEIEVFLGKDTAEMQFMKRTQAQLLQVLQTADVSQIRRGVVHLDIWFDNLNITPEGRLCIFDFDFCGNGWLCLDIAYYMLQLHAIEKYEANDYQPKLDFFLKGYESVTPISAEEKRLLPALGVCLYFFYLGVQCKRYHNWSNSFLNENYLKRFINGLVKRYYELHQVG